MKDILKNFFGSAPRGSQSRIADQLGVRVQTVNKWAQGYNIPEPQHWRKLEELIGLEPGTFTLGGLTPRDDTAPVPAEVMALIRRLGERLDAVESQLGLSEPARSGPSDRATS